MNLHRIAEKIKSPLVLYVGRDDANRQRTCTCYDSRCIERDELPPVALRPVDVVRISRWLIARMHNGQISQFSKIKRRLLAALPEPLFLWPQGHTDSEFAFMLFLSHLNNPTSMEEFSYKELKDAMLSTIRDLNLWSQEAGIEEVRAVRHLPPAKSDELLRY